MVNIQQIDRLVSFDLMRRTMGLQTGWNSLAATERTDPNCWVAFPSFRLALPPVSGRCPCHSMMRVLPSYASREP